MNTLSTVPAPTSNDVMSELEKTSEEAAAHALAYAKAELPRLLNTCTAILKSKGTPMARFSRMQNGRRIVSDAFFYQTDQLPDGRYILVFHDTITKRNGYGVFEPSTGVITEHTPNSLIMTVGRHAALHTVAVLNELSLEHFFRSRGHTD